MTEDKEYLPEGWHITDRYIDSRHPDKDVFKEIAASRPLKEFPKLTEAEIIAMQCRSTRAKILGTYDTEYPNQNAWKAVPDAETTDDAVGIRLLTPEEIVNYEYHRKASKNTQYASKLKGVSDERKESATNALYYSQGVSFTALTPADRERITGVTPIKSQEPPAKEESKEDFHFIQFNKATRGEDRSTLYICGIRIW